MIFRNICFLFLLLTSSYACRDIDALDPEMRYQKALSAGQTTSKRTNDLPLGLSFGMSANEVANQLQSAGDLELSEEGYRLAYPLPALPGIARINYQPVYQEEKGKQRLVGLKFSIDYAETDAEAADDSVYAQKAFYREVTNQFRLDYRKAEFLAIPDPDFLRVVVQVDNNRRLDFFRQQRNQVQGQFIDLSVLPKEPLLVKAYR